MYGYEIVRAVRLVTGDAISLGEGVIYPVLHGLEKHGALKARRKSVGGRTRVYYSLTPKGELRFERLTNEWDRISGGIRSALAEPQAGPEHASA